MPIFAIPKLEVSDKLRLINDLSAGRYSVNSMVRPEAVRGAILDGIPTLGDAVRDLAPSLVHGANTTAAPHQYE